MKKHFALILLLSVPISALAQQQQPSPPEFDSRCSQRLNQYARYAYWLGADKPNFLLDLDTPKGRIYYFGAEHLTDPSHPQFAEIEKAWNTVKPTIAFYEGPNRPIAGTGEETIKKAGESGYVRFLATRDQVPFLSLEPSPQDEAAYIMKRYPADQVLLFYVLRETARLRERQKLSEEDLKKAVAQLLEKVSKMKGAEGVIPNIDALDTAYRKYWSEPAQWWQAPAKWFDPAKSSAETGGKFTNEINRASSEYRNLHMYRTLASAALEGKKVFAVVGRNHVPMQEKALRCALE